MSRIDPSATWTDRDELIRRIEAVEALVARWQAAEDRRSKKLGARIAIAATLIGYAFMGYAVWYALH